MLIEAKQDTFLKKDDQKMASELPPELLHQVKAGKSYHVQVMKPASNGHIKVELGYGAGTWFIFKDHWLLPLEVTEEDEDDKIPQQFLTETILKRIMPNALDKDIRLYVEPLNKVCEEFDISTSLRVSAFIAQLAHESGSLRYKEEIASGEAYEGRLDLGNTNRGDGRRYKGRGLIQLTGRSNYRQAGLALGLPLEENPEIVVSDPYINSLVAGWFWSTRGLNSLADKGDFLTITRRINGGTNGLADRESFYTKAKQALCAPSSPSLDWDNPSSKVSKYFTVREVTQGDPRRIPREEEVQQAILELAKELDKIREAWGSPILVTSWFRPSLVNLQVGGVRNSRHIIADAADIRPGDKARLPEFQQWLDSRWFGALGYGQRRGFVHIDMRNMKGFNSKGLKGDRWVY